MAMDEDDNYDDKEVNVDDDGEDDHDEQMMSITTTTMAGSLAPNEIHNGITEKGNL
jgi:hypothetical protein